MNDVPEIHARPKIIGARIKRTEDPRLLTGLGAYTDDRQMARVLHAAFRRSDQSHARIRAIDCTAARAAPGVIAVFTAEDLADQVKPLVATSRMKNYFATPILPLARGKVRYVGEPVVGIVAQNRYQAEDALELVTIDYEPLPVVIDPEQAVKDGAPLLYEEAGSNVLVSREFKRGDIEAAFATAPVRIAGRFRMHRKTPVAIEPRACVAEYDAGRQALTLYSATQVPGIVRDALAQALDIPGHQVRVVAQDVGGGFGGKGSLYPEEIFVCAAARGLSRSIKWTADRMEDLLATSQGFDEIVDAENRARRRGPHHRVARRRHRRYRRVFDLSVDRGARTDPSGQLSARALSHRQLSGPRARRRDLESAARAPIAASAGRSRPSSWSG